MNICRYSERENKSRKLKLSIRNEGNDAQSQVVNDLPQDNGCLQAVNLDLRVYPVGRRVPGTPLIPSRLLLSVSWKLFYGFAAAKLYTNAFRPKQFGRKVQGGRFVLYTEAVYLPLAWRCLSCNIQQVISTSMAFIIIPWSWNNHSKVME